MNDLVPGKKGRPTSISNEQYVQQIELWISEGIDIDSISPTSLFKSVGGTYKRACDLLGQFKAGYEVKNSIQQPQLPETIQQKAINMATSMAIDIYAITNEELGQEKQLLKENYEKEKSKWEIRNQEQIALIEELSEKNDQLEDSLAQSHSQINEQAELVSYLQQQLDKEREKVAAMETKKKQQSELIRQQEIRLREKDQLADDQKKEMQSLNNDIKKSMNEHIQQRETIVSLEAQKKQLTEVGETLEKQLESQKEKTDQLETSKKQLEKKIISLEIDLATTTANQQNLTDRFEEVRFQKEALASELKEVQSWNSEQMKMISKKDLELDSLREKIELDGQEKKNVLKEAPVLNDNRGV